jgi:IS5 family transposase
MADGFSKRPENADKAIIWHIAMKRSVRKAIKEKLAGWVKEKLKKAKASVRAKVEQPFHVLKNLCWHRTTRYRGLLRIARSCIPSSRSQTWC